MRDIASDNAQVISAQQTTSFVSNDPHSGGARKGTAYEHVKVLPWQSEGVVHYFDFARHGLARRWASPGAGGPS